MVATPVKPSLEQQIIKAWQQLPQSYKEVSLISNFISPLLKHLGLNITQIKHNPSLGKKSGLIPDYLVYQDINQAPVLVIEAKKRVSTLATTPNGNFIAQCKSHSLYQDAVGYPLKTKNNGIKQYLDNSNPNIDSNKLANYGLVINGDFFQFWRRVDGLILPLTPIQRITEKTIPELIKQLKYCIFEKPKALVTGIWNRKGGVAKTTNTLNIASVLALKGKKVLLIDFDTQTDLTRALRLEPKDYHGYLGKCLSKIQAYKLEDAKLILKSHIKTRQYSTQSKEQFSLDILPGNSEDLESLRIGKGIHVLNTGEKIKCLQKIVEIIRDSYDYILIDNSPASDIITAAILGACDTVLIPCDYSKKTLHHAADIENNILPKIRQFNYKKSNLDYKPLGMGIVFSNCPPNNVPTLEQCIQKELTSKSFKGKQYNTRLKIYAQTKLAEYKQMPVVCWDKSPITRLYYQLTDEIFLNHNFIDC